jgi:superfamily II DNA or RNA helicase
MLRAVRVDSIEVYEPGDQGTITGGRRVHRVYNLEVAEQNTYIAEGFVVHNCHHAPASTIYKVLEKIKNAPYRIGLSATDWRDDGADLMIEAAFGPRIVDIDLSALIAWGYLVQPEIWMHEMAKPTEKLSARSNRNWNSVYSHFITHNEPYHQQVVEQAREWYWNGRTVLTLVERVQHGKILAEMMNERGMPTVFLSGKDSPDVRMRTFEAVMDGQLRSLVATSIADEGLDLPALDALILAGGSKSSTRAYQRIGRILRLYKNKEKGLVADYRCRDHEWLDEHARRRLSIYKKEKAFEVHFKR